jgi:voltage-gated potassium channel
MADATPIRDFAPENDDHAVRQVRKDLVIAALALISVAIGIYDLARPHPPGFTWLDLLDLAIVAVFIIDFAISAHACGSWAKYTRAHWFELPALLPLTGGMVSGSSAIPLLRSVRLVRLLRVARLVRLVGTAARLRRFWNKAWRIARRAHLLALVGVAAGIVAGGATLAWIFESPVNRHFQDGGSVAWWALNMFTNVAYVDFQPVTTAGRFVAGVLEFTGIGFIGLFTASLAGAILTDKGQAAPPKKPPTD